MPGGLVGEGAGLGEGPADAAVTADDGGFVGDGDDGGEADAEPSDGAVTGVTLRGGAQRGEGLDAGGVEGAPVLAAHRTPSRRVSRSGRA